MASDSREELLTTLPDQLRLLLVEDNPGDAELVRIMLGEAWSPRFEVVHTETLRSALERLRDQIFDVVLLDLSLDDAAGLEAVARLREHGGTPPIVVMTGNRDQQLALHAIQQGAQGFLVKGEVGGAQLVRNVLHAIERQRMVLELDAAHARERHFATHDALTKLPNRLLFLDRLQQAIETARRTGKQLGLLFLDLDDFKAVNDTLGHAAGDRFLQAVAERLVGSVRASDTVARFGGDEFVILCGNLTRGSDAVTVTEKVLAALSEPISLEEFATRATVSVGVAIHRCDDTSVEDLLKQADAAMYQAKQSGRNRYVAYRQAEDETGEGGPGLGEQVRGALERGELEVRYRPRVDLAAGRIAGAELQIHWRTDAGRRLSSADFFSLLERNGMADAVREWGLGVAAADAATWADDALRLHMAISDRQLWGDALERLTRAATEGSLALDRLTLELDESDLARRPVATMEALEQLRRRGVRIVASGFGAGTSSLRLLRDLPLDGMKLDAALLQGVPDDRTDTAMASALVSMAGVLGIQSVAGGVAAPAQLEHLSTIGCDIVEGPLFGEPVDSEGFAAWLRGAPLEWDKPEPT
ncbi:MAG: EAL domain-containing protein [Proteobacteria bacterium]|nr:EAL domain-containing protein [Pseudomonadota bacterium]